MKKTLLMIGMLSVTHSLYADPIKQLTLTDKEMQKLKQFFPVERENEKEMYWRDKPIQIHLPLGKEKQIIFPSRITADLKGALTTDQIQILNNNQSLYIKALKPFPETRTFVTLQNSEVILLDLMTSNNATDESVNIHVSEANHPSSISEHRSHSAIDLMRFAWQQFYIPSKYRDKLLFNRVAMQTQKFVPDLVYGDKVIAYPKASWKSDNLYVTAVMLRNKYPHSTQIDLAKDLCGQWRASIVYPRSSLAPYGNLKSDSTMLFLISSKQFAKALGVCHGDA